MEWLCDGHFTFWIHQPPFLSHSPQLPQWFGQVGNARLCPYWAGRPALPSADNWDHRDSVFFQGFKLQVWKSYLIVFLGLIFLKYFLPQVLTYYNTGDILVIALNPVLCNIFTQLKKQDILLSVLQLWAYNGSLQTGHRILGSKRAFLRMQMYKKL